MAIFTAARGATKSFLWCDPTLLLRLLLTVAAATGAPLMVRASAVETASRHRIAATKKDELRAKAIVSLVFEGLEPATRTLMAAAAVAYEEQETGTMIRLRLDWKATGSVEASLALDRRRLKRGERQTQTTREAGVTLC